MIRMLVTFLQGIPFWIWIFFVTSVVAGITYLITRRWQSMVGIGALTALILSLATALYFWENFLNNHFFGEFDAYGLPTRIYPNGWELLWHSLYLWLVPALLFAVFVCIFSWWLLRYLIRNIKSTDVTNSPILHTTTEEKLSNQLEFHDLRRQAALARQQLKKIEVERKEFSYEQIRLKDKLDEQSIFLDAKDREIELLQEKVKEQEAYLHRAQTLIDLLRREISESEENPSDEEKDQGYL